MRPSQGETKTLSSVDAAFPLFYVGLMSGTSIDAVDAALVRMVSIDAVPQLVASHSHSYPAALAHDLRRLSKAASISYVELCEVDTAVGREFALATLALLANNDLPGNAIRAIGSHGQTLFHHPHGENANTIQIGNPNVIAQMTKIATVADLRRRDIAAGGQGAPLLPALHQRLFADRTHTRGVLNLGGIANLTVLPAGCDKPNAGFDTGPANTLLDAWIQRTLGETYDKCGAWAETGIINKALLACLCADPYLHAKPPKSTGVDYFNLDWLFKQSKAVASLPPADVQRTLTRFSAVAAIDAARPFELTEMWAVGGGCHNALLMQDLSELADYPVNSAAELGVDIDSLEALAFGWFAHTHLEHIPVMPKGVTGEHEPVVLGALYPGTY